MPGKHRPLHCDAGHHFYVDNTQTQKEYNVGSGCLVQVTIETTKIRVRKTFCSIEHFRQWASSQKPERETLT